MSARVGDIVGDIVSGPAVNGAEPARFTGEPRGTVPWHEQDRLREQVRELAPVLIGVGAVLAVGAAVALWRRRRR
ncbi:hypothetical protein [Thermocatellispora tengchongensis]|uniref:hypothetical protein n=1 Tax=Thermocatellispora tengchongensis TaxID=1073253 RepID=UPI003638F992